MTKEQAMTILKTDIGVPCVVNPHWLGLMVDAAKKHPEVEFLKGKKPLQAHAEFVGALGLTQDVVFKGGDLISLLESIAKQCIPEAVEIITQAVVSLKIRAFFEA